MPETICLACGAAWLPRAAGTLAKPRDPTCSFCSSRNTVPLEALPRITWAGVSLGMILGLLAYAVVGAILMATEVIEWGS